LIWGVFHLLFLHYFCIVIGIFHPFLFNDISVLQALQALKEKVEQSVLRISDYYLVQKY